MLVTQSKPRPYPEQFIENKGKWQFDLSLAIANISLYYYQIDHVSTDKLK